MNALSDVQFLDLAIRIGYALHGARAVEDAHRAAGRHEEANKMYAACKEEARSILQQSGLSPGEFDKRLQKMSEGRRFNVKLERIF